MIRSVKDSGTFNVERRGISSMGVLRCVAVCDWTTVTYCKIILSRSFSFLGQICRTPTSDIRFLEFSTYGSG